MASPKKKPSLVKKAENYARFSPTFKGFYAIFADLRDAIFNPSNWQMMKLDPMMKPLPSYWDLFMIFLAHTVLNGTLLWLVLHYVFFLPFSFTSIFVLGLARYLIGDVLHEFLWKPLTGVSRAFGGMNKR